MKEKKLFLYFIEIKEKNGSKIKYPVYKRGEDFFIKDHLIPRGKDMEDEIRDFFNAEFIGPVLDKPAHQDLKFKDIK